MNAVARREDEESRSKTIGAESERGLDPDRGPGSFSPRRRRRWRALAEAGGGDGSLQDLSPVLLLEVPAQWGRS